MIKSKEINETTDNPHVSQILKFTLDLVDSISTLVAAGLEHDLECNSELRVKERVEKWIDGGVEVSKPLQKGAKSMYVQSHFYVLCSICWMIEKCRNVVNLKSGADCINVGRKAGGQTDVEGGDEDPKGEPAHNEGDDEDAHLDENSTLAHPL